MKYTEELRKKIVEKVKGGVPYRKVADEFHVPKSSVWSWCKQTGVSKAKKVKVTKTKVAKPKKSVVKKPKPEPEKPEIQVVEEEVEVVKEVIEEPEKEPQ